MKLTDRFGTRYFAVHMVQDLDYVMATIPKSEIIDLSGACMAYAFINRINYYQQQGYHFVDNENTGRGAILEESWRRYNLTKPTFEKVPLPTSNEDLVTILENMSEDAVYIVNANDKLLYTVVVFVTVFRPEIQFCLDGYWQTFYNFILTNLNVFEGDWVDFNYIYNGSPVHIQPNESGLYYVPGAGMFTKSDFLTSYTAIPYEFGSVDLSNDEIWLRLVTAIMESAFALYGAKKKTLQEVL